MCCNFLHLIQNKTGINIFRGKEERSRVSTEVELLQLETTKPALNLGVLMNVSRIKRLISLQDLENL